jgi:hypothetical protein
MVVSYLSRMASSTVTYSTGSLVCRRHHNINNNNT